jgi:hypothetical protein
MTAEEALERLEMFGDGNHVPQIYRDMGLTRLRILVAEEAKPPQPSAMDRMPIPRLNYNPLDRALGRDGGRDTPAPAPTPAPDAVPSDEPPRWQPKPTLRKALANPRRLRLPSRQRASFLYHLEVCGCVEVAAARAGVNRGTLYRWRLKYPRFAERWDEAIARRSREVGDDIVLQASQADVQPVFYAGKKVGERRKIHTRLLIHVQNRLDVDRRRAEDRDERRELALLKAQPADEAALAERLLALMEKRLVKHDPVTPEAAPETEASASDIKDLADAA